MGTVVTTTAPAAPGERAAEPENKPALELEAQGCQPVLPVGKAGGKAAKKTQASSR